MRYQLQILSEWGTGYSIDLCALFRTVAVRLTCTDHRVFQNAEYAVPQWLSVICFLHSMIRVSIH